MFSGIISSFFATWSLSAPRTGSVILFLSAIIRTVSPFSQPILFRIAVISSSLKNFANEHEGFSSTHLTYANPLAPIPLAISVSLSISFLVRTEAEFFATIALTLPPFLTASANTAKLQSFIVSDKSCISISNLVSGLSEP